MMDADRERRAWGYERFLVITDGVVAIAITLLVLPLVDAVSSAEHADDTVESFLPTLDWEFFSFVLSFIVIAMLWQHHRDAFSTGEVASPILVWTGVGWMLAVILIPVSTALIVEHGDEKHALVVYLANLIMAIACTTHAAWILHRNPDIAKAGRSVPWDYLARSAVALGLACLALVLAWTLPLVNYWVLLLLLLPGPIVRAIRRRRGSTH